MKRAAFYTVLLILIVAGGLALRVCQLDRRPMHNDEANQAVRAGQLLETGVYRYDRTQHHGPSLYFFSLPLAWLRAGRNFAATTEVTYRLVPVLFGVGLIALLGLLGDGLGRGSVLVAAVLTCISPAMVYFSRFYIQETLLVFFAAVAIACGWRYSRGRARGWALAAGLAVGLMHATKETCVLSFAAAGAGLAWLAWQQRRQAGAWPHLRDWISPRHLAWAGLAAAGISVLFFSAFFTYAAGPVDSILTYLVYLRRAGGEELHNHPWYFYLQMLCFVRYGPGPAWSEAPILVLAAIGAGAGIAGRAPRGIDRRLLQFLVVYTVCLVVFYSLIPYKTPWCLLSFLHGMILLAGVGASVLWAASRGLAWRGLVAVLLAGAALFLLRQTYNTNFRFAADPRNPYVYAHTSTDFLRLTRRVEDIAGVHPAGRELLIEVFTTPYETWPLPWYLRGYPHVGYWNAVERAPAQPMPDVIIARLDQEEAVRARYPDAYQVEFYGLRPEVLLALYIKRDLWEAFLQTRTATVP